MPESPIDFEALLKKYIQHVGECEGAVFLEDHNLIWSDVKFTEEEWAWLKNPPEEESCSTE